MNASKLIEHFGVETDTPAKPIVAYTSKQFDLSNITCLDAGRYQQDYHIRQLKQPLKLQVVDKIVIVNVELKKANKRKSNWRNEYDLDEIIVTWCYSTEMNSGYKISTSAKNILFGNKELRRNDFRTMPQLFETEAQAVKATHTHYREMLTNIKAQRKVRIADNNAAEKLIDRGEKFVKSLLGKK